MQSFDYTGVLLIALISAFIAAIGRGFDSLLLGRHIATLDLAALRLLLHLQEQELRDIPKATLNIYLKIKDKYFGSINSFPFHLKLLLLSAGLTLLLVPIGSGLGWALHAVCDKSISLDMTAVLYQATSSYKFSLLAPLVPLNFIFDLVSTVITVFIISHAVHSIRSKLYAWVVLDFILCIFLVGNLFFFMGNIKPSHEIDVLPYFQYWQELIRIWNRSDCLAYTFLTQKAVLSFTVLIPTTLYLATFLIFVAVYEAHKINRFVFSHLLEKSVEDQKKSLFSIFGIAIGLIGVCAKTLTELFKLFGASGP